MNIHDACDYIIAETKRSGRTLTLLQLQTLLYYAQAWYLAFQGETLFRGKFQAWRQGPINREVYDRFAASKSMRSELGARDVTSGFAAAEIAAEKRAHLDRVLASYAKYDDFELQEMISREAPWREARGAGGESCEREIDEEHMRRYYSVSYLVSTQTTARGVAMVLDAIPCGR